MNNRKKLLIVAILLLLVVIIIIIGMFIFNKNRANRIIEDMQDKLDSGIVNFNTKDYIDKNISKVSKKQADEMVNKLEDIQIENEEKYFQDINKSVNKAKEKGEELTVEKINNLDIVDIDLKNLVKDIKDNGYVINEKNNTYYLDVDYTKYEDYKKYVSSNTNEYIDILITYQTDRNITSDKTEKIINELDKLQELNDKTKDNELKENISNKYNKLLSLMLTPDNTEYIKDENISKLKVEYKELYEKYLAQKNNTKLNEIISEYMNLFKQSNYEYTSDIKVFYSDIWDNGIEL